ncbi:MAG TPA: DNA alkylation repair protein [Rhizomicrobium sp.]|nr:DNA alkylation repair protein [Rhizomicrobium sp.]
MKAAVRRKPVRSGGHVTPMTAKAAIARLAALGSEKRKEHGAKVGIDAVELLGVSTADVRRLGKEIGRDQTLADQLWDSGIHEAQILAVLVAEPAKVTETKLEKWLGRVRTWDLCDHLCNELVLRLPDPDRFIRKWAKDNRLYFRRAAFATMACRAVHAPQIVSEEIDSFLKLICAVDDDRPHVMKAVSWALREIGKIDLTAHDRAMAVATDLIESGSKAARWIGRDAMRELETLVAVPERQRLLTAKSKMGRKAAMGKR